jgi:hypothetical protein
LLHSCSPSQERSITLYSHSTNSTKCPFCAKSQQMPSEQYVSIHSTFACLTDYSQIYYAALVYATQNLAIAHSIQKYSFLTATHDKILAWNGIGSAFATLYHQIKWPTSSLHILVIWMYLGGISVLHVTTPAVLSTQSFNLSILTKVNTQSIPQWSDDSHRSVLNDG